MTSDKSELVSLLEAFLHQNLRSVTFVARIEDAILDELDRPGPAGDPELLNELLDLVTRYVEHPSRDERYLYGPDVLARYFRYAVGVLRSPEP